MKSIVYGLALSLLLAASHGWAEEQASAKQDVIYLELKPSFVANFQANRIRYIKADVTLQIEDSATAEAVSRHQPSIRHNLVMLFSRQLEDEISTMEGKQQLKEEALKEVITALEMENEPTKIKDILFTSFMLD